MYEVRAESGFSAAHFLRDYNGKCENLHGHNYKVRAHVRGASLDEGGMLFDFVVLRSALGKVCGALDHTNLNDIEEFGQNPSAELIARHIFYALCAALPSLEPRGDGASYLWAVDVYETPDSRARYSVE